MLIVNLTRYKYQAEVEEENEKYKELSSTLATGLVKGNLSDMPDLDPPVMML